MANADQIRDLEERIQSLSLSEVLASPVGDHDREENARREVLKGFVLWIPSRDTTLIQKLHWLFTES